MYFAQSRSMKPTFTLLFSIAWSLNFLLNAQESVQLFDPVPANSQAPDLSQTLENYALYTINPTGLNQIHAIGHHPFVVRIPDGDGTERTAYMTPSHIFKPGYKLRSSDGMPHQADPGLHFHGRFAGEQKKTLSLSVYANHAVAIFGSDKGNVVLAPLDNPDGSLQAWHVAYPDLQIAGQMPFECHMEGLPELPSNTPESLDAPEAANDCRLIGVFMEASFKTYQDRNSSVTNVQNFFTAFFNEVALLYADEGVNVAISEIFVWTSQDQIPTNSSSAALQAFGQQRQDNFNGDLAHWVTTGNYGNGGIAWLDVLCSSYNSNSNSGRFAYSNIANNYQGVPTYSWTVMVFSHEMGHNIGSRHTHNCNWPGGAIDSCYAVEGNCYSGPAIPRKGTIMSYCHLTNQGIDFNQGFGPLPGQKLRDEVSSNNASCLGTIPGTDPQLNANSPLCEGDTLVLTTAGVDTITYQWSGPNGFNASGDTIRIPNVSSQNSGNYTVIANDGICNVSDVVTVQVTVAPPNPSIQIIAGTYSVPVYANATYQWYDQNGAIPGANQNTIIPLQDGSYYAIIQLQLCNFVLYSDTVVRNTNSSLALWEALQLSLAPNPASEVVQLRSQGAASIRGLRLLDLRGSVLYTKDFDAAVQEAQIPLKDHSAGLYFVEVQVEGIGTLYQKLVIKP